MCFFNNNFYYQGIPGTPGTPGATGPSGPQGSKGEKVLSNLFGLRIPRKCKMFVLSNRLLLFFRVMKVLDFLDPQENKEILGTGYVGHMANC